ncbi:hypothetical protein AB9M62_21440 [Bacillales bacterium AN1005]
MKFRKRDYLISFLILFFLFVSSIMPDGGMLMPVLKSILASLLGSAVIGTLTNLLIKKRKTSY